MNLTGMSLRQEQIPEGKKLGPFLGGPRCQNFDEDRFLVPAPADSQSHFSFFGQNQGALGGWLQTPVHDHGVSPPSDGDQKEPRQGGGRKGRIGPCPGTIYGPQPVIDVFEGVPFLSDQDLLDVALADIGPVRFLVEGLKDVLDGQKPFRIGNQPKLVRPPPQHVYQHPCETFRLKLLPFSQEDTSTSANG